MLALLLTLQAATPAMAPPPPLPISDCFAPGPFIIFFPKGSATLTDEARSILAALVAREADPCGVFRLGIVGHTDRGERDGLDRRRAEAVRRWLARRGLRALIGPVRGVGDTLPRIARPTGVEELQNRRVEISAVVG